MSTVSYIKSKLDLLHRNEEEHNREIADIDKQIGILMIRKKKLSRFVSKNMKYRNLLIDKMTELKKTGQ